MTLARSTLVKGPAIATYDSAVIYSSTDIIAEPVIELKELSTSVFGKIDDVVTDILYRITLTPHMWTDLTKLFPYTNPVPGASIFGASDKNLVIQTRAGQQLTFKAAAVTRMPSLHLGVEGPLLGEMEFTAIGTDNTAWSDEAKRVAVATVAFSDTSFDKTLIYHQPYTTSWGAVSPWDAIETEDGVTFESDLQVSPEKVDSSGTVNMSVVSITAQARFLPKGISETNLIALLKLQGSGVARGMKLSGNEKDLTCAGTGVHFILYNAAPTSGPLQFGAEVPRSGEIGFVSVRTFTAGALDALFYVGAAAP